MRDKVVEDAMVPLDSVFMLNIDARMDKATMNEVGLYTGVLISHLPYRSFSKKKMPIEDLCIKINTI